MLNPSSGSQPFMHSPADTLYAIAANHQGYFTAAQARKAGYRDNTHGYHVNTHDWIRESRGIYRWARFPESPEGEWVRWSLWSRNRQDQVQAILSHQTALAIYELTDIMPAKVHLTVPPRFRRGLPTPQILQLHRALVSDADREMRAGYALTKPLRTLLDLAQEGEVMPAILVQAGTEALKRGLISRSELKAREVTPEQKPFWLSLKKALK
jgi:hypothetical protein